MSSFQFFFETVADSLAINQFFTDWYNALTPSIVSSSLIAQPLITELDPRQKTGFVLGDLLTALTAGLAFIGIPEVGAGVSAATAAAGKTFLTGLQQAPGVAKAIWPNGTLDSQSVQLGNIDSELSSVMDGFTTAVQAALKTVMSDLPSFIAFAENGAFSGQDSTNVPQDFEALELALRTYVLSTTMSANNWRALPITSVTKEDVESNVPGSGGWDCTFGENNICTNSDHSINVWYSDATENAYVLTNMASFDLNPFNLLNDIVANNWSTLETLFDSAFDCTLAGRNGQPLEVFTDDGLDFSCVSQLPMCSCGTQCPVALINGACPFHCSTCQD